ncbi:MAG: PEP-CTERM sorting domain-containing protein [Rhodoferax sp.]|nr:PEP-CTERM sorting domain-containing protein [Rhodoferax sp.]
MRMKLRYVFAACMVLAAGSASAVNVDEATFAGAGGDYNNLLSPPLPTAVVFGLDAGTNTFAGTFGTPGDQGDTFLLNIGPLQTLTGIRVTFATNAGDFNPVAINQNSRLVFDLTSSNQPVPLVDLALTGRPSGPVVFASGPLSIGAGQYNTTILSEVLALNSAGMVGYQVAFDVSAVPEPTGVAMMLAGTATIGLWVRRRRPHSGV